MRFLIDENFPYSAVERLRRSGHDVVAVRDGIRGAPDEDVLAKSRMENRVLVTADKDFGEMIFARRDLAAGVLLVRSRTSRPAAKVDLAVRAIDDLGERLAGSFVVVGEGGTRVRRIR